MSGYKERIEIDPKSENVEIVDDDARTVDESGRISVGRANSGETFEKIILVRDGALVED